MQYKNAARGMLSAADAFLSGAEMSEGQRELAKSVSRAGCFAAAAYEKAPSGGADIHALTRAFLLALIDPTDPALDYLRAGPEAGAVARDAAAQLSKITKSR